MVGITRIYGIIDSTPDEGAKAGNKKVETFSDSIKFNDEIYSGYSHHGRLIGIVELR